MTVFIRDTFTAANDTALNARTAEVGGQWTNFTWTGGTANSIIRNNRVRGTTYNGARHVYSPAVPPSADYTVDATIFYAAGDATNNGTVAVYLRADTATQTGYYFEGPWFETYKFFRIVNGTLTQLGGDYTPVPLAATNDTATWTIEVSGDNPVTLRAYKNGVLAFTRTDSAAERITTAGRVGLRITDWNDPASDTTGRHLDTLIAYTGVLPIITDADDEAYYDTEPNLVITGTGFGATQGTGSVKISTNADPDAGGGTNVTQTVTAWSDTSITFTAAKGALSTGTNYNLFVKNDAGNWSAARVVQFVNPPAGVTIFGVTGSAADRVRVGSSATITGTGFGASQGTGSVTINGVAQTVTAWANGSITITGVKCAPYGVGTTLTVTNGSAQANSRPVQMVPATGWQFVNLVAPLAPAANRLTTTPDLAPGDQIAYGNILGAGVVTVFDDASFYNDAGVTSFQFEAWDGTGWGTAQTQTLSGGSDTIPPSVPTGVGVGSITETAITLAWSSSTDTGGSGLSGYRIYRNGSLVGTVTAPTVTYTDTGLSPYVTYQHRVSAFDGAGNESAQSAALSTRTLDATPPTMPTAVSTVLSGANNVQISWVASTDVGSGVAGSRVFRNGTRVGPDPITATLFIDGPLTAATYDYTVRAIDVAGNLSSPSVVSSIVVPALGAGDTTPPTMPGSVMATRVGQSMNVLVTWSSSTDNVGVVGYRLFRDGVQIGQEPIVALTYTDANLAPGTYDYTVRAVDAAGNVSGLTVPVSVVLPPAGARPVGRVVVS